MSTVASRELRNQTRSLLDRVASGERITITVDGRVVAELGPPPTTSRWVPRDRLLALLHTRQADPALGAELRSLAPDDTDDLPL